MMSADAARARLARAQEAYLAASAGGDEARYRLALESLLAASETLLLADRRLAARVG